MCPASRLNDMLTTGMFTYPLEVLGLCNKSILERFVCHNADKTNFTCDKNFISCPMRNEFIPIALTNDRYSYDYCNIREFLHHNHTDEVINVLVFGGSVTTGEFTEGACCDSIEPKCIKHPQPCQPGIWFNYFSNWIKLYSQTNVNLYFLAHGGTTSGWASEFLFGFFHHHNIPLLKSTDLVFIDYSVNDQFASFTRKLELGNLVRKILHHSVSTNSTSYRPHIVLLTQLAQVPPIIYDYYDAYNEIAAKYNLSVCSYSEVVHSDLLRTSFPNFLPFLRGYNNYHVTWFAHLFLADMYATLLTYVTQEKFCTENPKRHSSNRTVIDTFNNVDDTKMVSRYSRQADTNWSIPHERSREVLVHAHCSLYIISNMENIFSCTIYFMLLYQSIYFEYIRGTLIHSIILK